jgi:hypothetical protein
MTPSQRKRKRWRVRGPVLVQCNPQRTQPRWSFVPNWLLPDRLGWGTVDSQSEDKWIFSWLFHKQTLTRFIITRDFAFCHWPSGCLQVVFDWVYIQLDGLFQLLISLSQHTNNKWPYRCVCVCPLFETTTLVCLVWSIFPHLIDGNIGTTLTSLILIFVACAYIHEIRPRNVWRSNAYREKRNRKRHMARLRALLKFDFDSYSRRC